MNRQPSKEELLRMYQQEANLNRERKALEKQSRQNEERETLDRMNREIETERRNQQNRKAYITNERMTDYKNFMQKKSEETVERRRVTKKNDDNIAGKIGGENRTFKRKNYEETSNNLILNPTREFIGRGRNTESDLGYDPNQPRGKSQAQARGGYNIINHTENNRRENIPSEVQEYIREERGNEQVNPKMHGEVEGIENLENYNPNVEVKPQTSEDEEYIKYYEYMRRKEEEERERMNQGKNQVEENPERAMQVYEEYLRSQQNGPQMEGSYSNDHYQNQNVNYLNRESGYNSNQMNPKYSEASVNEIDNRMQNMNIATESTQNEYLLNKMRNNGSNYNNINHTQANLVRLED